VFSPTVRDEIAFGPLNLGMPADVVRQRVDDTLAMIDIADLADRAPYQLSGGQKKRVAIASVLVMNPDVILFDEPTAALDPRTQQWLIELVVELADRCVVFSEEHRIVADGSPDDVLRDRDALLAVNLIHVRTHVHHPHPPRP
jgi:cobalt/nickel transport system ATP-binding protein